MAPLPLTVLTGYRTGKPLKRFRPRIISERGHRAEAAVLMRALRVNP